MIDKRCRGEMKGRTYGESYEEVFKYHHLDISGHDEMDEQDIGWRNGWC
jgi:hypothetical protein